MLPLIVAMFGLCLVMNQEEYEACSARQYYYNCGSNCTAYGHSWETPSNCSTCGGDHVVSVSCSSCGGDGIRYYQATCSYCNKVRTGPTKTFACNVCSKSLSGKALSCSSCGGDGITSSSNCSKCYASGSYKGKNTRCTNASWSGCGKGSYAAWGDYPGGVCYYACPGTHVGYYDCVYSGRTLIAATCTSNGTTRYTCSYCGGYYDSVDIAASGHSYTSTTSWTYKSDGYWYQKCARCDSWTKRNGITYYVNYYGTHTSGNSTSGTMSSSSHTYGTASSLTKNKFLKTGHAFLGWSTTPDGSVAYTDGASVSTLSKEHNGVINLYAVWERNSYQIIYDANGGTVDENSESTLSRSIYYADGVDLSVTCQKPGYIFLGWATTPDSENCLSSMDMPDSNVTLYAVYSKPVSDMKEAIIVAWNKNDTENYRTYRMNLVNTDGNGYDYNHSNIDITNDLTYSSTDDIKWGIILYDNAGNSTTLNEETPVPERYLQTVAHYIWDKELEEYRYYTSTSELAYEGETYTPKYLLETDEDFPQGYTAEKIDEEYLVTGAHTSKAYYIPCEYKLYFDENGGACDTDYIVVYKDYYYGELPVATREGYDFLGWYTKKDADSGTLIKSTDKYPNASDSTVYAHWKVHEHNVVYDYWTNGGYGADIDVTTVEYGAAADLTIQAYKDDGWKFVGWNTDPDATVGLSSYTLKDDDVVLYAIYKKDLSATFIDCSNDETVTRTESVTIYNKATEGAINVPKQNTKDGWTSLGWSLQTEAEATIHASSNSEYSVAENLTFYGVYVKNVTLSYDGNGSADDIVLVTLERFFNASGTNQNPVFEITTAPNLAEHSFVKWEVMDNPEASYVPGEHLETGEDIVLVAKWDKVPEIEAYDRYFTTDEIESGEITPEKLLEKVVAKDLEDGVLENGTSVVILDYELLDFTLGDLEVTYQATDSFGNVVTKTVGVHIVDTTVTKSNRMQYVRFISKEFYTDGTTLKSVFEGGVEDTSVWRTNEVYSRLLTDVLSAEKIDQEVTLVTEFGLNEEIPIAGSGTWEDVESTWVFTQDDIDAMKEYVNEYGYGNLKKPNGIEKFYELFGDCKKQ